MKVITKAQILTIYIGQDDKWRSGLLYPAIVEKLHAVGVAGATVLQATEGFGAHHKLQMAGFSKLMPARPIVIEVVDVPERIALALPILDEMIDEGLATVTDVQAIRYSVDPKE